MLGALVGEDARTQQRSMLALIPLASATDAIDAWGSRANAITRALNSSECLRQLRLCGLPVAGEVGVVYMCPSKVCGHKHPCSATPVQGEIAGRIPSCAAPSSLPPTGWYRTGANIWPTPPWPRPFWTGLCTAARCWSSRARVTGSRRLRHA